MFPSDCRICSRPLRQISRIPVCPECLSAPAPIDAEFFCVTCRTPFQNAFPLDAYGQCALCRSGLRGFDAAYCFGAYEGALRELIHVYKYGKVMTLARPLGRFLRDAMPRDEAFEAIVPVPLHWRRRWQRGFNQSGLLAAELSRNSGIAMLPALRRVRWTGVQAGLSNRSRRLNVAAAFRCTAPRRVKGKRLLLIDDVMTTGSTAAACATALKRAGAERVVLLALARVDRRMTAVTTQPEVSVWRN